MNGRYQEESVKVNFRIYIIDAVSVSERGKYELREDDRSYIVKTGGV